MKIRGIEVDNPIEIQTTIWECPFCLKKFINKNSYYNHIAKDFCINIPFKYYEVKQQYDNKLISKKDFYEWCYVKGYAYKLNITEDEKKEIGEELFNKISCMYED